MSEEIQDTVPVQESGEEKESQKVEVGCGWTRFVLFL